MELNISIFIQAKKDIMLNGTAKYLTILNMKYYGFCFRILGFGWKSTMLMVSVLMELLQCYTSTMELILDLLEIIMNTSMKI